LKNLFLRCTLKNSIADIKTMLLPISKLVFAALTLSWMSAAIKKCSEIPD
jgi:hypothetical protein